MPIDPNIALSGKGIQLQDPMEQYARFMTLQNAQRQNALADRQMAETNALNAAYARHFNPNTGEVNHNALYADVAKSGYGSQIPGMQEAFSKASEARNKAGKSEIDLTNAALEQSRGLLTTINPNSPDAVNQTVSWINGVFANPYISKTLTQHGSTPQTMIAGLQEALKTPGGLKGWIDQAQFTAEKLAELNKLQSVSRDTGNFTESGTFNPHTGEYNWTDKARVNLKPGEAQRIANEEKRLQLDQEKAARDADPAFQQRMAQARATGEAIAKDDMAAQQKLPVILARAETTLSAIDAMIGKRDSKGNLIKGSTEHEGFGQAVGAGIGLRFIPGTSAADFQARFDQIKGSSFLEAFESLKGGGAITEKEGAKATDAINRMSLSQSEDGFVRAALDLKEVIRAGVERAKQRATRAAGGAAGGTFLGFE